MTSSSESHLYIDDPDVGDLAPQGDGVPDLVVEEFPGVLDVHVRMPTHAHHQVHLLVDFKAGADVVQRKVGRGLAEVENVHLDVEEGIVVFLN